MDSAWRSCIRVLARHHFAKCRCMRLHAFACLAALCMPQAVCRSAAGLPGKLSSIGVVFVSSIGVVFVGDGMTEQLITENAIEYLVSYTQYPCCIVAKQESRVPAA